MTTPVRPLRPNSGSDARRTLAGGGQSGGLVRRTILLALLVVLAACQPEKFNAVDITGSAIGGNLALTDHTGRSRQLSDFRGKLVVVFFGFTQCPDVCPTTLSEMAEVRKKLGKDGERVQVLFVTVDPDRDTAAVLAEYVPAFDPSFLGLRGSAAETAEAAKEFKVFYQKVAGKTPTSYTMDHTAASFVFDQAGRIRLFVSYGMAADLIAADLKRLL
jgi:protein SCO1/2